jgi:hypothetical protein
MSEPERNMAAQPHRSALRCEGPGFALTVLPASPYEVSYVPAHHVIGFTFERQRGVDAFGSARRRLFDAEPWRLAFTPAGCDVFSASDRGGEYLMLSVAPETFARVASGIARGRLPQLTNVADPLFTPLAAGLRRAAMLGAAAPALAIEGLAAAAVERVSVLLDAGTPRAKPERRMTARRLKRILDHFEARLGRNPPRGPCKRRRPIGILSRPHVPGSDGHDAARGVAGAADRTSALADRSCLAPRRPRKPRGRCGRDRLLQPRPYDDGLPPRAGCDSQ